MTALRATGPALLPEGFRDLTVEVAEGRVVRVEDGLDRDADVRAVLLPGAVNAHVHLGDAFLRGRVPDLPLAELVAPPHGWKHRELARASDDDVAAGIQRAAREAVALGATRLSDFREGGPRGLALARRGLAASGADATVLARPAEDDDPDALARDADGLQVSALTDVPRAHAERSAEAAHRARKRFALHWSERAHEDVDDALALAPDFVVHAVHATPDDLRALAAAHVQVVLCPRSNARFGQAPPLPAMLDAGCDLALGTDNAMFHALDPAEEARALAVAFPHVDRVALLRALAGGTQRCLRPDHAWSGLAPGDPADILVVGSPAKAPEDALFHPAARWRPLGRRIDAQA